MDKKKAIFAGKFAVSEVLNGCPLRHSLKMQLVKFKIRSMSGHVSNSRSISHYLVNQLLLLNLQIQISKIKMPNVPTLYLNLFYEKKNLKNLLFLIYIQE